MNKKRFTLNYFQPDDYKFSLDSIQLAEKVVEIYQGRKDLSSLRCLDLCSGCGVIGLEIYFYLRQLRYFDFVEIQNIYQDYFYKNIQQFNPSPDFSFINKNYVQHSGQYDLIVCNPPYFFATEGVLSPSDFKNRCRFYLDGSFQDLILSIVALLAPNGEAYVLINRGEAYGKNRIDEARNLICSGFQIEFIGKIRITDLVRICHKKKSDFC